MILLLTVAATLQATAAGWAQNVSINLKNSPVEKVFLEMRRQTGYQFVYNMQMLQHARKVTINVRNIPLEQALKISLSGQPFTYTIVDSTVVIKPAKEPVTIAVAAAVNENIAITGVVKSAARAPLQGVSVMIKGTTTGSTTDKDGKFELKSVSDKATLVFSIIGYAPKEVKLSATSTTLNIVMHEGENKMEEVVVTGYQNVDRKLFTGATAKVNAKDAERNGIPDVSRMLEGQVAGVTVQNVSGTFGAAPKIPVRDATSLSGENKPLTYKYTYSDGVITLSNPTYDGNWTARVLQLIDIQNYFATNATFKVDYVISSNPNVTNIGGLYKVSDNTSFFYGSLRK